MAEQVSGKHPATEVLRSNPEPDNVPSESREVERDDEVNNLAKVERVYRYTGLYSSLPRTDCSSQGNSTGELYPVSVFHLTWIHAKTNFETALWVLYFLCSAIRSNVGLAQTMNTAQGHDLAQELNLSPHQVSTGLALFYVCYVTFDLPANLIMTKLSPQVWMYVYNCTFSSARYTADDYPIGAGLCWG